MDQRGGEAGEAQLVYPHSARQRMPGQETHQFPPSCHYPCLRPAQQLVSRKEHQPYASEDALLRHRLVGHSVSFGWQQAAAAHVVQCRNPEAVAQFCQVAGFHLGRESFNAEIAGVNLQISRRVIGGGLLIVPQVGAVGGAHVHQRRPTLAQHVGNPEAAAYFHRLGARYDNLASGGQRQESQQHR